MTKSGSILTLVLSVCAAGVSSQSPRAPTANGRIRVGPTVHVSRALTDVGHDEVVLAADRSDARRLIACSMINTAAGSSLEGPRSVAYVSFDNGQSWAHARTTELSTADPSCDYAPDGSAYFVTMSSRTHWDRLGTWTLELHRSPDGGRTWEPPRFSGTGDRPWLIVDRTSTATPTPIYVVVQRPVPALRTSGRPDFFGLFLTRSNDGGLSWLPPAIRLGDAGGEASAAVTPDGGVVLADGAIVVQFLNPEPFPGEPPSRPPLPVKGFAKYVAASVDGGRSLTASAKIANYAMLYGFAGAPGGIGGITVDPGSASFKDRLYSAWGDTRTGRSEIWLSYSDDKGATWSSPRIVSDDQAWPPPATGPDNNMPTLAVNKDGIVGLMWYDRRDNPDNVGFYPRFRASLDGGQTWLPSVRLSGEPNRFEATDHTVGVRPSAVRLPGRSAPVAITLQRAWMVLNGHTAGLAADAAGAFHALWVDNRSGINQAYTARVDVAGAAARHGMADLASQEEVTGHVAVELDGAVYEHEKHAITVRVRLRNTSNVTLRSPLVLRVLTVSSELGTAHIVNPDRGVDEGALWSFDAPTDGLPPGAATAERTLSFQWTPVRGVKEGQDVRLNLVRVTARVLGRVK